MNSENFSLFYPENSDTQGVSYAKDIAEKYGVTFDSIKESIDNRNS